MDLIELACEMRDMLVLEDINSDIIACITDYFLGLLWSTQLLSFVRYL